MITIENIIEEFNKVIRSKRDILSIKEDSHCIVRKSIELSPVNAYKIFMIEIIFICNNGNIPLYTSNIVERCISNEMKDKIWFNIECKAINFLFSLLINFQKITDKLIDGTYNYELNDTNK